MTEQIGKVTLDYTFYNGQDQYSDGDIENDLLPVSYTHLTLPTIA